MSDCKPNNVKPMKPIIVKKNDFINSLNQMIKESELPAFILEPILKDLSREVTIIAQKEYEIEKKRYEEALRNCSEECLVE